MNRYEIRCTEAQTKKALELGAPIEQVPTSGRENRPCYFTKSQDEEGYYESPAYYIPTCEEMVGWLEEQGLYLDVTCDNTSYEFGVWKDVEPFHIHRRLRGITARTNCVSRKEATLAAIDAALDYLLTHKQQAQ